MLNDILQIFFHFQGRPCLFQQDNVKEHSLCITRSQLHSKSSGGLTGLPAVQTCHIMKQTEK